MKKIFGILLLIAGLVLLIIGVSSSQHITEEVAHTVMGRFTNQTLWEMIIGIVMLVTGAFLLFRKK